MALESTSAPHPEDTIVAVSSAAGPAPRAIVRISGRRTRGVVEALFSPGVGTEAHRLVPGNLSLSEVHSPLPADLYFFASPHSYTGQDLAELHTLGSPPLVERLVADLLNAGARPARPGEFTLRAFLAGKLDLPQAEAVNAVIESGTDADLQEALKQLAGGITQPLHDLRDDLLNLLADTEAGLDFADEDIELVGKSDTLLRVSSALARLTNLKRQFESRTVSGRAVRIAIVGAPNAGKSSLFNSLAGGPGALVSQEAGTTRDYLAKQLSLDGTVIELIDTAGWSLAADTIEEQAQRLGREQTGKADVILWCVEAGQSFDLSDEIPLRGTAATVLKVATKSDRSSGEIRERSIPSSVVTAGGLEAIRSALAETVASLTRPPLAPSQSRCRHHVDSCIRDLQQAHRNVLFDDPPEFTALALRGALSQLGEMVGAVYTNDLLDRIFSRFCIGK